MEAIIPYLNFNGTAADAFAFYCKALKGEIVSSQTYGDAPMESKPEDKNKIMHAVFKAGDLMLMASDTNDKFPMQEGNNISLSLNFYDDASITETFNALAEGGKVTMALADTFWGAKFGMLTDKFGINWMLNFDKEEEDNTHIPLTYE